MEQFVSYQLRNLGHGQAFRQEQFLGLLHAEIGEKLDGSTSRRLFELVGKVINAQMAEVCHSMNIPGFHVALVELCDKLVYEGAVDLRLILKLHKPVD